MLNLPALASSVCTAAAFVGVVILVAYVRQERRR
jgi:hypothetical protein